ncbi:MAG: universal stress protein [Candidatus Obscuribacterales bacterium]|nr:universal stress protein [Candidatus Obscuribacterales bacterium]
MSSKSLLLQLDGSAQCRYAAEVCWTLAQKNKLTVNAQHVIDSLSAWDFLNFDIAGFIGSGPYFEAHEMMRSSLTRIGENLIEAYTGQAAGHNVPGDTFLDEGTTIREICWRAKDHEMVVIGQRSTGMGAPEEDKRRLPRRSIAETLTYYCPRPLLVVQDRCDQWKRVKILLSSLRVPSTLMTSCLDFAKNMQLEPTVKLVLVSQDINEERTESVDASSEAKDMMEDLRKLVPEMEKVQVEVCRTGNLSRFWKNDAERDTDSLLIVPVTESNGVRKTCFGTSPDLVVRYLNHSSVLFWMEEQSVELAVEERVSSAV